MRHNQESMTREVVARNLLPTLVGGFTLLLALLFASAWVGISALESAGSDATRMVDQQRATMQLNDEIQRQEGSLSGVFYDLAAGEGHADRSRLLERLTQLERDIRRTTDAGMGSSQQQLWKRTRTAADAFIVEVRATLLSRNPPSTAFYRAHQELIDMMAELSKSTFEMEAQASRRETERFRDRLRYSFVLLAIAFFVALAGAVVTIHYVRRMFHRVEWQASELARLSSRAMAEQEESARRFSRELHDHMGQTLSAIEANLVALHHSGQYNAGRIEDCLGLTKDAIDNVRQVAQLLRPSILDDFGLDPGLRWLAESFSERTGIEVRYDSSLDGRVHGDIETQLFRIAQEALTNVGRHSGATSVRLTLSGEPDAVRMTVADNGRGLTGAGPSSGMGLLGMRARARSAHGILKIDSVAGGGVTITVRLPRGHLP